MIRKFTLLNIFLIIFICALVYEIFLGKKNYQKRNILIENNNKQDLLNEKLSEQNTILEFEILNAKNSNEHIENFARERLNLSYPEEEFLLFEEKKNNEE
jgi:cell division protein FtsB